MNEEPQYIEVQGEQPQGVPYQKQIDRADFVDKIKPEDIVEIMRHRLLGEEEIEGKWIKIKSLQKKALSEIGAWEVSNFMLTSGTINTSISKLSQEQINNRLRALIKEVMIKLLTNWQEWKIKDVGQIYYIKSIVFSNALVVLSQAGEGSIQELFKTSVHEMRNVNSEKKEPSRLKRLLGMG